MMYGIINFLRCLYFPFGWEKGRKKGDLDHFRIFVILFFGQIHPYAGCFVDSKGEALDGSKTYKIHTPANIPAKEFWSLTVYDNQTRSLLQTDQQFPAAGSETKGIIVNKDGSVDIYF